ncbi:MAG: FAD-binding protein, partial [Candidatus Poribacteria bacterium]
RFLISEAVRGEGAILINESGERFMPAYHELAELAPRDVVSRAIVAETTKTNTECVYLDLRHLDANFMKSRFPTISEKCSNYGIDIYKDLIPVQVSAHFMMGGVKTNLNAETNVKGLYACGEVACTGVHGANRLASNSLLESLVFGVRSAKSAVKDIISEVPKSVFKVNHQRKSISANTDYQEFKESIQDVMWEKVGIIRNVEQLKEAIAFFDQYRDLNPKTRISFEVQNMLDISKLVAESAFIRQESRGAHYRSDYPLLDDENWNRHVIFSRIKDI